MHLVYFLFFFVSKIITLFILFSPLELDGVILKLENIQLKNSLQTTCQLHHTVLSATQNLHLGQADSIIYMKSMILLHNNGHKVLCVTRLSYWIQSYWMQYTCNVITLSSNLF